MNKKEIYNENISDDEEENESEDDSDEIIDNNDDGIEESVIVDPGLEATIKSIRKQDQESKREEPKFMPESKPAFIPAPIEKPKKEKNQNNNITPVKENKPPIQSKTTGSKPNINLDNLTQDEVLAMLLNTPLDALSNQEDEEKDNKVKDLSEDSDEVEIDFKNVEQNEEKLNNNLKKIQNEEKNFDTALNKVLGNLVKESYSGANDEIYDILLNDKEIIEKELEKEEEAKKVNISEKVNNYLLKKKQNLKELELKKNEEFNKVYTFAPNTNKDSADDKKKRNLNQFLKDQENYMRKRQEKLNNMKDDKSKKETEELMHKPKICETSKKLAQEKNKGENIVKRLYNNKKELTVQPPPPKKPPKKAENTINTEKFNSLYNEAKAREERSKNMQNLEKQKQKEIHASAVRLNINTNKVLFNKFKTQFYGQIANFVVQNEKDKKDVHNFTYDQLKELYFNLNFISDKECSNAEEEKKLKELFDVLKNEETEEIKIEHIFIFSLSILTLFEYYLLSNSSRISTSNADDKKKISKSNSANNALTVDTAKQQENLNRLNAELMSRIVTYKKYGGYDNEKNFIITLNSAKLIQKDYNLFYNNYSNSTSSKQPVPAKNKKIELNQKSYNRSYSRGNPNSRYNNNSKKDTTKSISTEANQHKKVLSSNASSNNLNMKRIEQLYKDNEKKKFQLDKDIEKYQKEKEENEKKVCTFKPKINTKTVFDVDNKPRKGANLTQEERIELLYQKGKDKVANKYEKTKDELELDRNKTEYTFKPEINTMNRDIFDKKNSVYKDEDFNKFNQRLKQGREEKDYIDSFKERGELFMKKRFGDNMLSSPTAGKSTKSFINNDNLAKKSFQSGETNPNPKKGGSMIGGADKNPLKTKSDIFKKTNSVKNDVKDVNKSNVIKTSNKNNINSLNNNINSSNNPTVIKKEHDPNERPLLEIDVNLKHGVKKKVIVYDGDTSEMLAQNFAEENSLDEKMKKKLQILIQKELDKLLQKIQEESCSSFKSFGD